MAIKYEKNAVKILPKIDNIDNKVVLYTEYDGNFDIGDKLFIMVNDQTSQGYYKLDSLYNSGYTYDKIGYTLLNKVNNQLTLDINYDTLGLTQILPNNCFIGTVYLKNSAMSKGTINATMFYNTNISSTDINNINWKQGIIISSSNTIKNIYFKKKYIDNYLKTRINSDNQIEYFYSENDYNNTLNTINLTTTILGIENCNIDEGIFTNCQFIRTNDSSNVIINNGVFENSIFSGNYIINNGYFKNSTITDKVIWNNGRWKNDIVDLTEATNRYYSTVWTNGIWENGYFPTGITWKDGRFLNGTFSGNTWTNGTFNNGTFGSNTWTNGTFNNGTFNGKIWTNGIFNNGNINDITWYNGTFNNGTATNISWETGIFNNGTLNNSIWKAGTFNNGTIISGCTWNNGKFINGIFESSTWNNGNFYNGIFNNSDWNNGNFYNGTIFNSNWTKGNMFFGKINLLNWSGGTWYNGVANNIDFYDGTWKNGVFNFGTFYNGTWKNGSFNSGEFKNGTWENGNFYFGDFYLAATWVKGTFHNGRFDVDNIPAKDVIGKKFVQYNKKGLVKKLNVVKKIPKLKKF